jgi:2-C-methyl-D-erythritol 4-phosphate cytidylyltransferase
MADAFDDASVVLVLLAAGSGRRAGGGTPKAFRAIGDRPMVLTAAERIGRSADVDATVVVVPAGWEDRTRTVLAEFAVGARIVVVAGGASRHESVRLALGRLPGSCEIVVCHDSARPFATAELCSRVVRELRARGRAAAGCVPVVEIADTLKRVRDGEVVSTEPRDALRAAQTPQAAWADALVAAHARALREGVEFSDDAGVLEWDGGRVLTVPGEPSNVKVTTEGDLAIAEALATTLAARDGGGAARG